jgi:hypothetical protein
VRFCNFDYHVITQHFHVRVLELNPSWDKLVPGNLVAQLMAIGDAETILQAAQIFRYHYRKDK